MFLKRNVLVAAVVFGALGSVGCMTYDFEPVQPLAIAQTTNSYRVVAKQLKPNVMILLDKSGSMNDPINNTAGAPSRMLEMRSAMNSFLTSSGKLARFGLMTYPSNAGECSASSVSDILQQLPSSGADDDSALQQAADNVRNSINNVQPNGGTPTGGSLRNLGGYSALTGNERPNYILLLTDGLPNCNETNKNAWVANDPAAQTACSCTLANPAVSCEGAYQRLGCLDMDDSVQALADLRAKSIQTIVVGFSGDFAQGGSRGPEVLNAMAVAGGLERVCPNGTNAECGSDNTCDAVTKKCAKRYFQTGNSAELTAALTEIANKLTVTDPCVWKLSTTPSDPQFLAVIVDGNAIARSGTTWEYSANTGTPIVTFKGDLCTKLTNATPNAAVALEFRIVESL
ncbi:MAG: adventurous gliding motility lipoprotein CglB [Myxococcaceae bacterium]